MHLRGFSLTLPAWFGRSSGESNNRPPRRAGPDAAQSPAPGQDSPFRQDLEILNRLHQGDERTFDSLYLEHYQKLFVFAARLAGGVADAGDVVHDVFASLWARRRTLTIRPPIRAYLYGAVRNRALLARRRDQTATRLTARHSTVAEPIGMSEQRPEIEEQFLASETARALDIAIRTLPDRQRIALELWLRDRLDPPEIAAILGVSAVAIRKRLAKAHAKLRAVIDAE